MRDGAAMTFNDHFSRNARAYAAHRPTYPLSLFEALAARSPGRALAWDVATGNGQAAVALAEHFEHVVATDASEAQLRHATAHARVVYRTEPAERSSLSDRSADLICVAQALHWFDTERFWSEVRRVGRPNALVAVWSYGRMHIDDASIHQELAHLYEHRVGPYWPPERAHVETGYASLTFPFERVEFPPMEMTAHWSLEALMGYVATWSAVARYRDAHGDDPLVDARARLEALWGPADTRHTVRWPLALHVGRLPP